MNSADLVARLRDADANSQQRVLGSRIFGEAADRIEAAEARAARLEAALRAVDQHERSSFFGPDGDKSRRASWRGAIRKVRAALDAKEAG